MAEMLIRIDAQMDELLKEFEKKTNPEDGIVTALLLTQLVLAQWKELEANGRNN